MLRFQQPTAKADMGSTGEIGSPSAKWRFESSRPTENAALWWAQHTRARQYRRPTSRLVAMQSLIVAAAKLMAVYCARLSTRHRQHATRAFAVPLSTLALRTTFTRAGATATSNHASLDAILEEKEDWEWRDFRVRAENTAA